ncbi:MAG: hypothetical protein ACKOUM_04120, partial [Sphingopyxis sp.]
AYKIRRDEDYVQKPPASAARLVGISADTAIAPAPSPARALQDDLSAALARAATAPADTASAASLVTAPGGWSLRARAATIAAMATALWVPIIGAIIMAAAAR